MSAKEGLYGIVSMNPVAQTPALLTGVELSWSQDNKRFYPMGSLVPASVLRGVISWEGSYKKAYTTMGTGMMTFAMGTASFVGTILPRGGTNPCIAGTFILTGGSLSGMSAEGAGAVEETEKFILYNVTMTD